MLKKAARGLFFRRRSYSIEIEPAEVETGSNLFSQTLQKTGCRFSLQVAASALVSTVDGIATSTAPTRQISRPRDFNVFYFKWKKRLEVGVHVQVPISCDWLALVKHPSGLKSRKNQTRSFWSIIRRFKKSIFHKLNFKAELIARGANSRTPLEIRVALFKLHFVAK